MRRTATLIGSALLIVMLGREVLFENGFLKSFTESNSYASYSNDITKEIAPTIDIAKGETDWEQVRIKFQYSVDRIPDVLRMTPPKEIPRILHFAYLSPELPPEQPPISKKVIKILDMWQAVHPNYHVALWRNQDVIKRFPETLETLRAIPVMSWVANIMRYFIVEDVGGVYLDTDMEPFRSIEPLREAFLPLFGTCEWRNNPTAGNQVSFFPNASAPLSILVQPVLKKCKFNCCKLNNNVIGAVAHHPALKEASEKAMNRTHEHLTNWVIGKSSYSVTITGPNMWREIASKHNATALDYHAFQMCGWKHTNCNKTAMQNHPHVYAMHYFSKSWSTGKTLGLLRPYNGNFAGVKKGMNESQSLREGMNQSISISSTRASTSASKS